MAAAPKAKRRKDSGKAGVEPGTRTFTTWTPQKLRFAEQQADSGNIRGAADLCDWILADDRVQGCMHSRVQSLLSLDPTFEQSGDKRRSSRVVRALEAQEDFWVSYPDDETSMMLSWGIMLGLSASRHRWLKLEDHGGRRLPCPEFWHPQHLRYDGANRQWMARVQYEGSFGIGSEEPVVAGDGTWILHTPYGTHRPQMLGLWRGLSRWVLLKYLALGDFSGASEKSSLLVGTSEKPGSPQKDGSAGTNNRNNREIRQDLARDIYERGREGVVILPPGFDLDLIQLAANSESIYTAQINLANEAIAIAIRGGNLTTNVKGGSLAATEAQAALGDAVKLTFDGKTVSNTLHDQSLKHWALHNFGDAALAPWPTYPTKPRRNHLDRAKALVGAADAAEALLSFGLEIDAKAFIDEWELNGWVKPNAKNPLLVRPDPNPFGAPPGEKPKDTKEDDDADA